MISLSWLLSFLLTSLGFITQITFSGILNVFPGPIPAPAAFVNTAPAAFDNMPFHSSSRYLPLPSSTSSTSSRPFPTASTTSPTSTAAELQLAARALGRTVVDVEGDGNCLFRAVADQLGLPQPNHVSLRMAAVHVLEQTPSDWFGGVNGYNTPADYLQQARHDGWHADQIEIRAMAVHLGRNIVVLHPDGQQTVFDVGEYVGHQYDITVIRAGVSTTISTRSTPIEPPLWVGYLPEIDGVHDGHYVSLRVGDDDATATDAVGAGDDYASDNEFSEDVSDDGMLPSAAPAGLVPPASLHRQIDVLLASDKPERTSTDGCTPKEIRKVLPVLRGWVSNTHSSIDNRDKLMTRLRAVRARVDSEPLRTPLHEIFAESFDDESLLTLLVAGLDSTTLAILSSDKPPTEADFCKLPLACGDGTWGVYVKLLSRGTKRMALYVGSTNMMPSKGKPGGFHSRGLSHEPALVNRRDFFNSLARKDERKRSSKAIDKDTHFPMTVRPFWRIDPSQLPQRRTALGQGMQIATRYLESVLHEWLDSFIDPHHVVWPDRLHQGSNDGSPVTQGIKDLPSFTPEERYARNIATAKSKYQQMDDTARRAWLDRSKRNLSKEEISKKNAITRAKRRADDAELSETERATAIQRRKKVAQVANANWAAELKLDPVREELHKFKQGLTRRIKELGPGREDEAMWRTCNPMWKLQKLVYSPGAGAAAKKPDSYLNPPARKVPRNLGQYKYGPGATVTSSLASPELPVPSSAPTLKARTHEKKKKKGISKPGTPDKT